MNRDRASMLGDWQTVKEYDIQQVCEKGHQITGGIQVFSEEMKTFCQECGATTLTTCPSCNAPIQGGKIQTRQSLVDARTGRTRKTLESIAPVPSYCPNCGQPYPWTKNKIVTAIQILTEFGDLEDKEKETIEQDVENIAKDVPEAELSARRIKRIWERGKAVGYEAIMEFASRTAAKILKD